MLGVHHLANVHGLSVSLGILMPLKFGKIGAAIALLTVGAFVLWLIVTTFFATEQAEETIQPTGSLTHGERAPG